MECWETNRLNVEGRDNMFLVLFLLWIIFNGKFTLEIALFGIVIAAAIEFFMYKYMDYKPKTTVNLIKNFFRIIKYVLVLIAEIAKANYQVMHLILNAKYEVEPQIIQFRTHLKSEAARATLANSITLTPGTITVTLEDDRYTVHCLDKELANGIEDSVFVKMLEKMEA